MTVEVSVHVTLPAGMFNDLIELADEAQKRDPSLHEVDIDAIVAELLEREARRKAYKELVQKVERAVVPHLTATVHPREP